MSEIIDFVDEDNGSDKLFDCEYTSVDAVINQVTVFTGAKLQQTDNGERCLIAYGEGYGRSAFFTDSKKLKDVVLVPGRVFPFRAIIKVVTYGSMIGFKFFPPSAAVTEDDEANYQAYRRTKGRNYRR